jgi:hypothetical protein
MPTATHTQTDTDRAPKVVDPEEHRDVDPVDAEPDAEHGTVTTRTVTTRSDEGPGARAAASLASATRGLGGLVRLAAGIIAAIVALGILFIVLEANPGNTIVSTVDDMARGLVGPFDGMFGIANDKAAVAVNWGIGAFAYLILGALIAWLIEWIGTAGLRLRRVSSTR